MHYYEFNDSQDKIIHLLVAALPEGLCNQTIDECIKEFGYETTHNAVIVFKSEYKSLINRLGGE